MCVRPPPKFYNAVGVVGTLSTFVQRKIEDGRKEGRRKGGYKGGREGERERDARGGPRNTGALQLEMCFLEKG